MRGRREVTVETTEPDQPSAAVGDELHSGWDVCPHVSLQSMKVWAARRVRASSPQLPSSAGCSVERGGTAAAAQGS